MRHRFFAGIDDLPDYWGYRMCEAHAFLLRKGKKEEKLLENVDHVSVEGDEIRMINIFGEQKILKASIKSYNSSENKILLEPIE